MVDSAQHDLLQYYQSTYSISVNTLPSLLVFFFPPWYLANYCASVVHPGGPSPSVLPAVEERSHAGENEPNLSSSVYTCATGKEAVTSSVQRGL